MRIAVMNLQYCVCTTRGYWQYLTTGWKYILPHASVSLSEAAHTLRTEQADIAFFTEVSEKSFEDLRALSDMANGQFFSGVSSSKGNAMLSRYEITRSRNHTLSSGILPRTVAEASIRVDDKDITLLLAHLALGQRARRNQLQEITDLINAMEGPVILGGDLNTRDSLSLSAQFANTLSHMSSVTTFPSWLPMYALQRVLLHDDFVLENQYVPHTHPFSDHLPLIVEARLRQ